MCLRCQLLEALPERAIRPGPPAAARGGAGRLGPAQLTRTHRRVRDVAGSCAGRRRLSLERALGMERGRKPTAQNLHYAPCEWRARVLEKDEVLPPDPRAPRGWLGLVSAFPTCAPCKRVSLCFSVPSHPGKGWWQPCRVHLRRALPSRPSTGPLLSTRWDLRQLSCLPSVAGQGGPAGQRGGLSALRAFPAHGGRWLGGVRVVLGCA